MNFIFRCNHRRITRPISSISRGKNSQNEVYVVCLDCGRQFAYDWDEMRILKTAGQDAAKAKAAGA